MILLRTFVSAVGALAALACRQPTLASEPAPAVSVSAAASATPAPPPGGVGSRVFVVERETESLGVYDLVSRTYEPARIRGLGNLRHAVMAFSPDLRWGYVATRSGKLSRVDLATLERAGDTDVSTNSIDIAIGQDGRLVATAEYQPGGVTFLDARTLEVVERIPAEYERDGVRAVSRATGIVDAPGQRFVCVLIEGAEIWVIDASGPKPVVERRVRTSTDEPYDAMITPDGRWYVVGHLGSEHVTVLDLAASDARPREVSLRDPSRRFARAAPVKLPHMASWAVAGSGVFVPMVGEARMVVLDRDTWAFRGSIPVRGHPVYAVAAPSGREVWVSFSGTEHDAWIDVIDTTTLTVARSLRVGERIYHLDFTPRGSHVLVSANQAGRLALVDARTYAVVDEEPVQSPSGLFGAWRAFRIGL